MLSVQNLILTYQITEATNYNNITPSTNGHKCDSFQVCGRKPSWLTSIVCTFISWHTNAVHIEMPLDFKIAVFYEFLNTFRYKMNLICPGCIMPLPNARSERLQPPRSLCILCTAPPKFNEYIILAFILDLVIVRQVVVAVLQVVCWHINIFLHTQLWNEQVFSHGNSDTGLSPDEPPIECTWYISGETAPNSSDIMSLRFKVQPHHLCNKKNFKCGNLII